MKGKKTLGYIFIVLGSLLGLGLIGNIPQLIGGIIALFSEKLDAYAMGYVFGTLIGWGIFAIATFYLWKYGLRWIKAKGQDIPTHDPREDF